MIFLLTPEYIRKNHQRLSRVISCDELEKRNKESEDISHEAQLQRELLPGIISSLNRIKDEIVKCPHPTVLIGPVLYP
jgi:hypothetical protein